MKGYEGWSSKLGLLYRDEGEVCLQWGLGKMSGGRCRPPNTKEGRDKGTIFASADQVA